MAGRKKIYDNSELMNILKGYSYLNQFTEDGLAIIQGAINKEFEGSTSKSKVGKKKILKLILNCKNIDIDSVDKYVNTIRMLRSEARIKKSMLYLYRNISIRASITLLEAYNNGTTIMHPLKGDGRTLKSYEVNKIRKMINNNTSLAAIKSYLNKL